MTTYLCDLATYLDAATAYEASDIETLINQIQASVVENESRKVLVVLKNTHYLTMNAFSVLYNYIREPHSDVLLVLVSSDKSRIFPPLLEYVQTTSSAV
jgi:DNA polymerase III gamma/tau subunit